MYILSFIAATLLAAYLSFMAHSFGVPSLVSDTYYQHKTLGKVFPFVMVGVAVMMLCCILDSMAGVQWLAFVGCGGLMFVGACPTYLHCEECRMVHKAGALAAAVGCVGWSLTVNILPTIFCLLGYVLYIVELWQRKAMTHVLRRYTGDREYEGHPWYWAEVSAFVVTFLTYWLYT